MNHFMRKCTDESQELLLKERFWRRKFWLRELPEEKLRELLGELKGKFNLFISSQSTREKERVDKVLITDKEGKRVGLISVNRECSLLSDRFFPVVLTMAPVEAAREVEELLKERLKEFLMTELSVRLSFYNQWGQNPEYSFLPEEFRRGIEPDFFYGIEPRSLAESFFTSPQSLLILFGRPGTGKSKLIQYLLSRAPEVYERGVEVLVLKGVEALREAASDLHTFLYYDVVVMDDIELTSLKRGEDEEVTGFISTLLSATDGFIPKRVKVIISTNQPFKEIDPALLRPSRLFDILELKEIDGEYFEELIKKRPELERVKHLFKERETIPIAQLLEELKGRDRRTYLKGKGISKREESYSRNLGF